MVVTPITPALGQRGDIQADPDISLAVIYTIIYTLSRGNKVETDRETTQDPPLGPHACSHTHDLNDNYAFPQMESSEQRPLGIMSL